MLFLSSLPLCFPLTSETKTGADRTPIMSTTDPKYNRGRKVPSGCPRFRGGWQSRFLLACADRDQERMCH